MSADRSDLFNWEPDSFRVLTPEAAVQAEQEALARVERLQAQRTPPCPTQNPPASALATEGDRPC